MKHVRGMEAVILQLIEENQSIKEDDTKLFWNFLIKNHDLPYLDYRTFQAVWKGVKEKSTFDRVLRKVHENARYKPWKYANPELYALSEKEWIRRHGLEKKAIKEIEAL